MRTLVYATDFSDSSKSALFHALALQHKTCATLHILHVFPIATILNSPTEEPTFVSIERHKKNALTKQLKQFVTSVDTKTKDNLSVYYHVIENNDVSQAINNYCKAVNAEMLIIGTTGVGFLQETLVGSTAYTLLKTAICPLLAIPKDTPYQPFEHIVYLSDLEPDDTIAMLSLLQVAEPFAAEITLLHVLDSNQKHSIQEIQSFEDNLRKAISYPRIHFHLLVDDNKAQAITRYVLFHTVSLLVLFERPHSNWIDKLFSGDLVRNLHHDSKISILTYNQHSLYPITPNQS